MTSDFDALRFMFHKADESQSQAQLAAVNWLADICIEQADKKKPGWTFERWKQIDTVYPKIYRDNPARLKREYLEECHSRLDHAEFHLRVFDNWVRSLIHTLDDVFHDREEIYDVKALVKKFPQLRDHLTRLGYIPIHPTIWRRTHNE